MSLLLALSVVLGCSVNAFAALPEEEETVEPQQLIPVYMDSPPMGSSGEYSTQVGKSQNGHTSINLKIIQISAAALSSKLLPSFTGEFSGITNALVGAITDDLINAILDDIDGYEDPYWTLSGLSYTQTKYSSRYPGCYKIVRVYTLPRGATESVTFYAMYQ